MRRVWWAWLLGTCLAAPACAGWHWEQPPDAEPPPVVQPPVDPPPVEPPPVVTPPVDPPPPPPPVTPPATVAALLDRIALGTSLADVQAAIGTPPVAPPSGAGPQVARWYFTDTGTTYLVFVVFEGGRATRKGSSPVLEVR